ncbi:chemotaxis protein CheA [Tritonibacter mobilis]|uniref:chemotaxis protein CheA n=1 Tax=Tritonibacter mobilis TaxID=379347 RepID=UPI001401F29A|nr:chemotaxis protein CheA [Tritonibacter mobilis]NHM17854.1 chemotaxis protein CheA [Tritonibacter mobilis]NHM22966.1 chemotaxis protein CheA [Tritonibacter mobilis]
MVQNNKVLTVSYGTFSCTLEGFEDSFDTMKAIAEYFRDLAADDRYFGAEPPQPDAEMMARIAQREIARQVEARSSDSGIHLRAAAAAPAAPAQVATPAAETRAKPQLEETATEDADAVEPVTDSPATTAEIADQIAEDREAVAETAAEDTDAASASVLADVSSALSETRAEDLAADADEADDIQDDIQADLADDLMAEDVLNPAPRSEDTVPATDSIAAKLQRIRAVVAKTPNRSEEFIEDEHADAVSTGENNLPEDVATAFEDDLRDDEPFEDEATHEESVSDILDRLDLTGARVDAPASDDAADAEDESDADTVSETIAQDTLSDESADELEAQAQPVRPQRPLKARTIRVTRNVQATPEDSDGTTAPDAAQPEAPETQDASDATAEAPSAEAESHANPAEEKPAAAEAPAEPIRPRRPVRGRVIRVKRAQADGSLIDATAEDVTPRREPAADAPKAIAPAAPKESSLSEDEEADLMAELAAVEAELMASSGSQVDATPAEEDASEEDHAEVAPEAPAAAERPAREILTASDASTDGDVSRLMAAADDRLSDEDAASSRETYNQLRAAVAAAQADTGESDDARREARTRAFREDLAHVVRPSRGGADDGAARSASQARPAPLKLVAEQRIDPTPEEKPAAAAQAQPSDMPVRPRRVSSVLMGSDEDDSAPAARQQDGAFATYATEKGAVELHELLEAAASYMSFVEGRESFSRPQLINKVRMLEGQDDFNREDSLRSFGMLLREGKLKKASNGRFSVSSQIGFRPGNRAAG